MKAKERVKTALNFEVPDKVPYGEYAVDFDTVQRVIGHETYYRNKARSQIAFWEGRRDEVVQSWKEDAVDFFSRMDCFDIINNTADASSICPPNGYEPRKPKKIGEDTWENIEGKVYKLSDSTSDISMVYDPHQWDREFNREDYETEIVFAAPDASVFEVIDYITERFKDDRFIIGPSGTGVGLVLLGGMERGLVELVMNPETVKAAARRAAGSVT